MLTACSQAQPEKPRAIAKIKRAGAAVAENKAKRTRGQPSRHWKKGEREIGVEKK